MAAMSIPVDQMVAADALFAVVVDVLLEADVPNVEV